VTTIEILGASDPPDPAPPLNARIAVMAVAILVVGAGILAALAGAEPVTLEDPTDPGDLPSVSQDRGG